ncbi:MAG: molybdopterin biosynthesis protein [Clostridiaceae bacterium]|jgi:putative molybdopterin biosynthesis protein|nr:molybdopterin biosynthesis protein [Clostridiaceae bacterium]
MAFQYLTNIPLDEALAEYMTVLEERGFFARRSEKVSVNRADGRLTASAVYAKISAPHYNACAMDGIAVYAKNTFGASVTTPIRLQSNQYKVVDTGDPLPESCDAVVMIEEVLWKDEGEVVISAAVTPWQHVRQIGEDICEGDMLLPSFSRITPAAMGAMLASGNLVVDVLVKPRIAIIPTGDEIVTPTATPGEGSIIEFNSTIFKAMLERWGADAEVFDIIVDDLKSLEAAIRNALTHSDGVIIIGGSSAGREDYTAQAIGAVGDVVVHGIAIRPGKPAVLGCTEAGKLLLGVPGYPVSGMVILEEILRPIIIRMQASPFLPPDEAKAVVSRTLNSSLKYREFIRIRLGYVNGKLVASPLMRGAGVVTSFVKADGIIDVPQNVEGYEPGQDVTVRLLRPIEDIKRTLVITGSHDPLIDETTDLMRRTWPSAAVASSHVGSMGGLFAIKRGEAHMGGIHLLDESTGEYNIPYISRHFPGGGVLLVEGVQRVQGLMVSRDNPFEIEQFADITRDGIRYINRQKGSGTRILCDYLCRKEGINPGTIDGYDREEFTHTAVAALIAAGSADVGLGIYAAAKIYGLDFIPICHETYDFLLLQEAYDLPMVQRWLETMRNPAFTKRVMEMGGYDVCNPGHITAF